MTCSYQLFSCSIYFHRKSDSFSPSLHAKRNLHEYDNEYSKNRPTKCIPHRHIPSNSLVVSNLWKAISFSYFWLNSRTRGNQIEPMQPTDEITSNRGGNPNQNDDCCLLVSSRHWHMTDYGHGQGGNPRRILCLVFAYKLKPEPDGDDEFGIRYVTESYQYQTHAEVKQSSAHGISDFLFADEAKDVILAKFPCG